MNKTVCFLVYLFTVSALISPLIHSNQWQVRNKSLKVKPLKVPMISRPHNAIHKSCGNRSTGVNLMGWGRPVFYEKRQAAKIIRLFTTEQKT